MKVLPIAALFLLGVTPAFAHVDAGSTASFAAGVAHPLSGLDHIAAMLAVGLWAASKGGRALWIWPCAFVALMMVGGTLGMAHVDVPFVEPAILASVVALGILVALAVDLPVAAGAVIVGAFALFHGHAHGTELAETSNGLLYMGGFAIATAALHLSGIGFAHMMTGARQRQAIRVAGALCVVIGGGLIAGII